ncbi:MAG TPA: hypothetical protein PLL26_06005 [Candidatus Dojkabacteria bacterium]|nr:hypothetical protein [Candidatus Dojkabacteria bacterium]
MIDTIAINIYQHDFTITDHNRFSPNTLNLFEPPYIKVRGSSIFNAKNNPSKSDIAEHGYLPRITCYKAIRKGGFKIWIKVEFSIPKLLYGNNFREVEGIDFEQICSKLKMAMFHMGVMIRDVDVLKNAEVSSIHYSKNIILTDYTTPSVYIKEIMKCNINMFQDVNQTDYRNGGYSFKYRSNNFEVIWYDKIKDLEQSKKSEKRCIENDNYIQQNMFDVFKEKRPFEVLRLEVRLGNQKKIKQIISKLNLERQTLDFQTLFSKSISQKVLLSIVKKTEENYISILRDGSDSFKGMLTNLQINNPHLNYSQALKYIGAKALMDEIGIREFREATSRFGNSQWYRLKKWLEKVNIDKEIDVFKKIRADIEKFEMVKLDLS